MEDKVLKRIQEQDEEVARLTNVLGSSLCGARLFCKENDCIDCANCKGGQLAFRQTATELYKMDVRVLTPAEIKERKKPKKEPQADALKMVNKELRHKLNKAEHDRDRFKARVAELTKLLKNDYTRAAEDVIEYLLHNYTGIKCALCANAQNTERCDCYDTYGVKACREGMIKFFAKK